MDGAQIKIKFKDLKEKYLPSDEALREEVRRQLIQLAEWMDIEKEYMLPLEADVVAKIRDEERKFKFDRKNPYPLPQHNNLSVQINMPTPGKVGVAQWNSLIEV